MRARQAAAVAVAAALPLRNGTQRVDAKVGPVSPKRTARVSLPAAKATPVSPKPKAKAEPVSPKPKAKAEPVSPKPKAKADENLLSAMLRR